MFRHLVAGALLASFVAASSVAVAASSVAASSIPDQAEDVKIQPGAPIQNQCTLGWVFDGVSSQKGHVYVATAGRCVHRERERVLLLSGLDGTPVLTIGRVARLVSSSDGAYDECGGSVDYALIRVANEHLSLVDPSMKGHPAMPTGVVREEDALSYSVLRFSGYGNGFHHSEVTRQNRLGLLHHLDSCIWSGAGGTASPATPPWGDYGGPVAGMDGGEAVGVVGDACITLPTAPGKCNGLGGTTVERILKDAATRGLSLKLRTV